MYICIYISQCQSDSQYSLKHMQWRINVQVHFLLYLLYRCIILYGKLDVTLILLRLRFQVVIYCSFAPIAFVGYGIVANSKTMIINRQYFSQMGKSQGKNSLVNYQLMFTFECVQGRDPTQKSEILT